MDILRINKDWYVIVEQNKQIVLLDNGSVIIEKPLNLNNRFVCPELHNKQLTLPCKSNCTCAYYSAATIVYWTLQYKEVLHLSPINGSPLYYFLERCMLKNPAHRTYLLI